jgi:uncharacterized protein (DUF2062 family)
MPPTPLSLARLLDHSRGLFRRTVFRTYRLLKHPRLLKASASRRWFARHFLDKRVWKPTQHTLAGGVAVGLLVSMQLLPMQMPAAAILAAVFRVNIPVAIAMCWLSNPVTIPALVPLEYALGKSVLSWISSVPATPFPRELPHSLAESWLTLKEHAPVMLFGGLLLGGALAPVGYAVTFASWRGLQSWTRRRRGQREGAIPPAAGP